MPSTYITWIKLQKNSNWMRLVHGVCIGGCWEFDSCHSHSVLYTWLNGSCQTISKIPLDSINQTHLILVDVPSTIAEYYTVALLFSERWGYSAGEPKIVQFRITTITNPHWTEEWAKSIPNFILNYYQESSKDGGCTDRIMQVQDTKRGMRK